MDRMEGKRALGISTWLSKTEADVVGEILYRLATEEKVSEGFLRSFKIERTTSEEIFICLNTNGFLS